MNTTTDNHQDPAGTAAPSPNTAAASPGTASSMAGQNEGTLLCPNLPRNEEELERLTNLCRAQVNQRALYSSAGNLIPIPLADAAIDIGMLTSTLNFINETFGLSSEHMDKLSGKEQKALALIISNQGAEYAGKVVTKYLVTKIAGKQAGKIAGKQVSKYVPIIGQLVAGSISYATLRYFGMRHIAQCREIIQQARGWKTDTERKADEKQAQADAKAARQAGTRREVPTEGETQSPYTGSDSAKAESGLLDNLCRRAACIGRGFKQAFSRNTPPQA